MKTILALGVAGGFLLYARGWVGLLVILWIASRVSPGLAVAILREVLRVATIAALACRASMQTAGRPAPVSPL